MTTSDPGQLAQTAAALPLNATTLIGVFTGPAGDSALIRTRDGAIHKLTPGQTASRLTLLAITNGVARVRDARGNVFDLALAGAA